MPQVGQLTLFRLLYVNMMQGRAGNKARWTDKNND